MEKIDDDNYLDNGYDDEIANKLISTLNINGDSPEILEINNLYNNISEKLIVVDQIINSDSDIDIVYKLDDDVQGYIDELIYLYDYLRGINGWQQDQEKRFNDMIDYVNIIFDDYFIKNEKKDLKEFNDKPSLDKLFEKLNSIIIKVDNNKYTERDLKIFENVYTEIHENLFFNVFDLSDIELKDYKKKLIEARKYFSKLIS